MNSTGEEKPTDGMYVASADASWNMIFTQCPNGI